MKKKEKSRKNVRSREQSLKKERELQKVNQKKIKIQIFDDSKKNESLDIKTYLNNNKEELNSGKINLETYINKVDTAHEEIFKFLNQIFENDINKFFKIYENEFFKLTLEQRFELQKKFQERKGIVIPNSIKKNIINETNIEKIFINILKELITIEDITIENIEKVFLNNNVYLEKEIDIKIPNKYGTKELKYYSLLNDLLFYFRNTNIELDKLFSVFFILGSFINQMDENDEFLISKSNYLINILYMYLENKNIDLIYFHQIVETCLPFNEEVANKSLQELKNEKNLVKFFINKIPINDYKGNITGNEVILIESPKIKIETLSKNINWNIGSKFYSNFLSEDFPLCINYPENCKYNCFTMGEMGTLVDDFFNHMIKSAPMKQAMIIDTESSKYKYLFNNKKILNEFKENTHLVPLPFKNYFGFTDKKSFDIYINVSYKTDNEFIKVLKKYNIFFITKSHEFKHGSRIYLRIYDDKIKLKTPTKDIKKYKGFRKYLGEIFDNTQKNLNILFSVANPKEAKKRKSKVDEYGDILELSLFGYKYDELFLKSVIFCLSESSWNLSPEEFYHNFSIKMMNNANEKLVDLCKEGFLKNLLNYYNSTKKEESYGNLMLSKDSDFSHKNKQYYLPIERQSHLGIREINMGKRRNEIITIEDLIKMKEKENEDDNESDLNEDDEDFKYE